MSSKLRCGAAILLLLALCLGGSFPNAIAETQISPDETMAHYTLDSFIRSFSSGNSKWGKAGEMTHAETVAALRELGITIPEQAVEDVEASMATSRAYLEEYGFNGQETDYEFPLSLLMHIGMGSYDSDTGMWVPSSLQVYAFDTEVLYIEGMYQLYLQGLSSIIPKFQPADVHEHIETYAENDERFLTPEGKTTVSFMLNGKRFEWTVDFYGDWFNDEVISLTNELLKQEGFDGRIHSFYDGGQGMILLYGDKAYGKKLREIIPQSFF